MTQRIGIRRPRVAGRMPAGPLVKASTPTSLPGGLALPSGSQVTNATAMLGAMLGALQGRTAGAVNGAVPLDRSQGFWSPFGPGAPLYPSPINQPNPRTGQADPRQTEYPISYNILSNDRPVPWTMLRAAADKVDIIRLCLRTRKDELCQLEWGFGFTADAEQQLGITSTNTKRDMRDKYSTQFAKLKEFWGVPDKTNDLNWSEWLGMLLEERFVLDATTIYPRLTYGGDLASLEVIDGATIKPLIDQYGNRPAPPAPAYQQWLYGFPRGEYTDDGASDTWEGTAGSLIYKPYTRRAQSPFGFPEVEQALISAEVYLRRQDWMRKEYTAGTLPRTMLKMDMSAGQMTPEQRRSWQVALNDELAGDTSARQDFTLLPGGFDPVVSADMAERYKADYDEFLVKLLCAHMATQPSEIGFTPSNGLGGAGFSDAQEDVTYRKSLRPTLSWLIDIVNQISRQYLDMPAELTFQFLGMESEDEDAADQVAQRRVSNGRMTLNEDRDRTGQPRYDFDEADKPMLMTGRGLVFIEGAAAGAQPGVEVGPAQAQPTGAAPSAPPVGGAASPPDGQDQPADDATTDAAKAELAAFSRFLTKRGRLTRPFAFTALDKADADVLNAVAETDAEAAAELAKRFNASQPRDANGKWLGGALARLVAHTGSAPRLHAGESPDFHSLDDKFSVGGTRLTAARLGPPSISHEETKRQIAGFMDDHPELFTKGTHVAVQDHKGQRRLARAGSAVALVAALSGLGGQISGDEEHFTEIPDAGPAASEMYNQFHGIEDKDDTFYLQTATIAAGHKADDAAVHEVVRRFDGRSLVKLNKDWADMTADEREAFLESVADGVESTGKDSATEKADGGGARGREGAPEGARRGDDGEYATYPLHAPGAGP